MRVHLRRGTCFFMLAAAFLTAAAADVRWDSYANNRFTFVVDYPASLVKIGPSPTNNDGREFHARTGTAIIAVWGQYLSSEAGITPAFLAGTSLDECADRKAAYRLDKPPVQAVSCITKKGAVLYYKSRTRKDVLVAIEAHYLQSEKAQWNPVITRMSRSLFVGESDF